jgi:2-hydroxychromene-2-carboxylate isomerase
VTKVCEYYFAPTSPFAYLGHPTVVELARRHDVQLVLKPCDLGRVFSVSGGLPLAQRAPQRQNYRLVELARWSAHRGMPLNLHPKFFPVSGDPACRLIAAAQLAHGTERTLPLIGAIGRALWAEEENIADEATLARLADGLDLNGAALLKAAAGANVQNTVAGHTEDAIANGVFGSPWFVYEGEPFWGQDRLEFLERAFARA